MGTKFSDAFAKTCPRQYGGRTRPSTIQTIHNSQNDRVVAKNKNDIPVEKRTAFRRKKNPPTMMVWASVTTDGKKTLLVFIEEGVKINQNAYLDLLAEKVLPWVGSEYGDAPLVFQQDGAPSHTARRVQRFCEEKFWDFWDTEM